MAVDSHKSSAWALPIRTNHWQRAADEPHVLRNAGVHRDAGLRDVDRGLREVEVDDLELEAGAGEGDAGPWRATIRVRVHGGTVWPTAFPFTYHRCCHRPNTAARPSTLSRLCWATTSPRRRL